MKEKENRINTELFKEVFKKGTSYSSNLFYIKVFNLGDNSKKKYSFVISKSVSKLAVIRNLIKRRAKNIVRTNIDKIEDGYAVIFFFANKKILKTSFKEMESQILEILKKTKM